MKKVKLFISALILSICIVLGFNKESSACIDNPDIENIGYCTLWNGYYVCVHGGTTCDRTNINQ